MSKSILGKIKSTFMTMLFYPLFIVPYMLYCIVHKITWLVQYIFTAVYIERICGFKRKQKVIQAINSLTKLPQNVVIALTLNKFELQNQQKSPQKIIENKIIDDYISVLIQIHQIKSLDVYLQSEYSEMDSLTRRIQQKVNNFKILNKKITVVTKTQRQRQYTQKLSLPVNNSAPLIIVFSKYENTCHIPCKYLVNAQIAFNHPVQMSNKYDLYRSFCQYAYSKQRNGK